MIARYFGVTALCSVSTVVRTHRRRPDDCVRRMTMLSMSMSMSATMLMIACRDDQGAAYEEGSRNVEASVLNFCVARLLLVLDQRLAGMCRRAM